MSELEATIQQSSAGDREYRACRKLLAAVFLDAVNDLHRKCGRLKDEAEAWIFGAQVDPNTVRLTFETACQLLDFDPGDVRKRLKEKTGKGVDRIWIV
ncbi:hypothetical protein CMI37_35425 [Candidatus Pacearchaeota archaeon]|nr:hypothetical protein [Candidatus Pacearchaeota archaeon]